MADEGASTTHDIVVAGEALRLHADRALYWPAQRALLIADLHLGKDDVFRRAGVAVPQGDIDTDLARLDALLAASQAESLVVLGDFLHGALHDAAWLAAWRDWRRARGSLSVVVIAGNHDRALDPARLGLDAVHATLRLRRIELRHAPPLRPVDGGQEPVDEGVHILCGHLHPVLRLRAPGVPNRMPLFWHRRDATVLPAFASFSGGHAIELRRGERGYLCAPDALVEVAGRP
jgi:uncharacterized protein